MVELKTQRHDGDASAFVDTVPDETRRQDARTLLELLQRVTGEPPAMWGKDLIGFGEHTYRYASGRTGTWFDLGFSPRKRNLTVYTNGGFDDPTVRELLAELGPHTTGRSCLYLTRLSEVDLDVLERLLRRDLELREHDTP